MAVARPGLFRPGILRPFAPGPKTWTELMDRPYWERPGGGIYAGDGSDASATEIAGGTGSGTVGELGGGTVGGAGPRPKFGGHDGVLEVVKGGGKKGGQFNPSRIILYKLEVHDDDGTLVNDIEAWSRGKLRLEVDAASSLRFRVAGTDDIVDDLVLPNRVWVRDRWGFLIEQFELREVSKTREGDAIFEDVEGQSTLAQLAREPVTAYTTGIDVDLQPVAKRVDVILSELMATQQQSPAIGIMYVHHSIASYETPFSAYDTSMLGAIKDLQRLLPKDIAGHFFINALGYIEWHLHIGTEGETLSAADALPGITYKTNFDGLVTRLEIYGMGYDHDNRVKLTDPGADQANVYIDSDNTILYGIRTMPPIVDRRIKYPESLLKAAQRVLDGIDEPIVQVSVNAIDLSKCDSARFADFNDLYIGSRYRAIDTAQSIDVVIYVVAIEYNMDDPLPVELELKNRRERLSDLLEFVIRQLGSPLDVNDSSGGSPRYPNVGRTYPVPYSQPPGHAYKDLDFRKNGTVAEWYDEDGVLWTPVSVWVEYTGP